MTRLDPFALEAIWERLLSIVGEMSATLMRTSFSSSVRFNGDYTCAVFDTKGRMLAQVIQAGPAHMGGMLTIVSAFFERFPPETLVDGDVFVTNDPWLGCGHTPDIYVIAPVFRHERLVGLTGTCVHHVDIGGRRSPTDNREIFEEGLIIPLAKLYRAGAANEDIFNTIRANVRFPDIVIGDIRAQLASDHVGAARMIELLEDYELEGLIEIGDAIIERTAQALRDAIGKMPNGTYSHEAYVDRAGSNGAKSAPLRIATTVGVTDSKLVVDLTGTSPQVDEPLNAVMNVTRAYVLHAIRLATNVPVPNNVGALEVVDLQVPEGTLLSAKFPAPLFWRIQPLLHVPENVLRALEPAIAEGLIAGSSPHWFVIFHGEWPEGRRFVSWQHWTGGMGARPDRDGLLVCFPADVADLPCEVLENEATLLVERRELVPDSGGPGRFRGGCGQRMSISLLPAADGEPMKPVLATVIGQRILDAAPGLRGGAPGAKGEIALNGNATAGSRLQTFLYPGDQLTLTTAGGGGYGVPWQREPEAVRIDVLNGLVSIEAAARDYGVVIEPGSFEIDIVATEQARATLEECKR